MKKEKIESSKVPAAIGPYSQAIKADDLIFVSGQLPIDANSNEMASTIEEQTHQSLKNIQYILEEAGSNMNNIVKTTVLLSDMNNFAKMNEVYVTYFTADAPARVCYEVAALPKGALVEIEAIAIK